MLKRFDLSKMIFQPLEGERAECLIPVPETGKVEVEIRCEKEVDLSVLTVDGEPILLEHGRIVRWSGKLEAASGVQIAADTGFWYRCQLSRGWFDPVDPVPMKVELVTTQTDVLKSLIEERIRQYQHAQQMSRPMTEEEWEETVLDIATGDLEFEAAPDEFGLGYEERLAEFKARQEAAEQSEAAPEVTPTPAAGGQPNTAPVAPNSSST